MATTWNSIVAGVDASLEGATAATMACALARTAKANCHLVHAVREPATEIAPAQLPMDLAPMARRVMDLARDDVAEALRGSVPPDLLNRLEVRLGRSAAVLSDAAVRYGADAIVVGGKHHTALGRWLAGSTVHDLLRASPVPVLVAGPGLRIPRRILAAVDLSEAARPTLHAAQRYAELFGAELLVLHVVESVPLLSEATILPNSALEPDAIFDRAQAIFDEVVWPLVRYPRADRLLRHGTVLETVRSQVASWRADLLIVGSHGKGFVNRLLLGSMTQRLADDLPTSVLVVPAVVPARSREKAVTWVAEPVGT